MMKKVWIILGSSVLFLTLFIVASALFGRLAASVVIKVDELVANVDKEDTSSIEEIEDSYVEEKDVILDEVEESKDYMSDSKEDSSLDKVPDLAERNAANYRSIESLDEIYNAYGMSDRLKQNYFYDNYQSIEKVAFKYNNVTVLLYDFTLRNFDRSAYMLYDFSNPEYPYYNVEEEELRRMIDRGGYYVRYENSDGSFSGEEFVPISCFQVYDYSNDDNSLGYYMAATVLR